MRQGGNHTMGIFFRERRRAATLAIVMIAGGLVGACAHQPPTPEVLERADEAKARTRQQKSLANWADVRPADLKDVDPDRLKSEGAALLVIRMVRETPSGERMSGPAAAPLREVETGVVRAAHVEVQGTEAEVGWGVLLVEPGRYVPLGGPVKVGFRFTPDGGARDQVDTPRGHVELPAEAAVEVHAGDVIYVGTQVMIGRNATAKPDSIMVRDEHKAAVSWTKNHLPVFAPRLQPRLLPSIDHVV